MKIYDYPEAVKTIENTLENASSASSLFKIRASDAEISEVISSPLTTDLYKARKLKSNNR